MFTIPEGILWWKDESPAGADWLARLPRLVADCAEQWELQLQAPFEPASVSYVAPATRADGSPVVLKVVFPEPESREEPDALAHWAGRGAVRLVESDRERGAMLMERCDPGTMLWGVPDDDSATSSAAAVLARLWESPAPGDGLYRRLTDVAAGWASELSDRWELLGRSVPRALIERAIAAARDLGDGAQAPVLLHQDLHGANVLRHGDGWVAIDPKPMVGDRAFDIASLVRDRRDDLEHDPDGRRTVTRRLDLMSEQLGLDRERAREWAILHALAWGHDTDSGADPMMLACAVWLAA